MTNRAPALFIVSAFVLAALAMSRGIDHDESQYVAAAVLAWRGLPYRDFAYLQTPLQPLLLAPLAAIAGIWAYPALRLANALLGAVIVTACYRAGHVAGLSERAALAGAGVIAGCDIFLFSVCVARNDALPAALLALALAPMLRAAGGEGTAGGAALIGLLLASAAAAKISYAVPAAAYGLFSLWDRRHRPAWIAAGALPAIALVGALFAAAPDAFWFGVIDFPARAPAEWYHAVGRPEKLALASKAVDVLKFLALGPAGLALCVALRDRDRRAPARLLDLLIVAGLIAGLLPQPTWRQYLLPALMPLSIRLGLSIAAVPPGRLLRVAFAVFAAAGLAPSIVALADAVRRGPAMAAAMRDGAAIGRAIAAAPVSGPVATLSPQFLSAAGGRIDQRFATGPFYFRSTTLLDGKRERRFRLISRARIDAAFDSAGGAPAAILIGGEGHWTSGDERIDAALEQYARRHHWRRLPVERTPFRLYLPPR